MPTAVAPYTRRGIAVDSKAVEVVCDLLNRTLSEIPSVFGRLAYFCYLRDPHVGLYRHYILTEVIGEHEAQIQLREAHVAAFEQWLTLNATRRQADLERYLSKVE